MTGDLVRRGRQCVKTDMLREKGGPCANGAGDWWVSLQAEGCQGVLANTIKLQEAKKDSSLQVLEGAGYCPHSNFRPADSRM